MHKAIRVLIADDHPLVRYGLAHMISSDPGFEVVGQAADVAEVTGKLQTLSPDVTVLDMEMGDAHGVDALRAVRAIAPEARVIIFTAYDDVERVAEAVELGVQGFLLKESAGQVLLRAIRSVYEGGTMLDPDVATKLLRRIRGRNTSEEALSGRQAQVLTLLTEGKSNRSISERLFISERTVKFHVSAIMAKLHATNRTEVVSIAAQRGLVHMAQQHAPA